MKIRAIYLRNFRSFEEKELLLSPGVNIFHGPNGAGKTTILEALYLLSTGHSFRTSHLSELIRTGASFFYLEALLQDEKGLSHKVELSFDGKKKSLKIDTTAAASFTPLLGLFPSVLYAPSDALLITGSPGDRRRFFNLHLAQKDPVYVHQLSRFWRSMKQRNTLLKEKRKETECWEEEMAKSARYLYEKRRLLIEELSSPLLRWASVLSGSKEAHILRFHPSVHPDRYLEQMAKNRKREEDLGATLTGPHRDDLSFWIGEKDARSFASEGQKKSLTAALKMAEWEALSQSVGFQPMFAVDDLTHSLDPVRQANFFEALLGCGQVCIATPLLPPSWASHTVFEVKNRSLS